MASESESIQYSLGYQDGFLEAKNIYERPKGEWNIHMTGYQGKEITSIEYRCSQCNRHIVFIPNSVDKTPEEFLAKYPFCHCGAKMGGTGK